MYVNCRIKMLWQPQDGTDWLQIIPPFISSVDALNDSSHIGSTCDITMPATARLIYKSQPVDPETGLPNGPEQTLTEPPITAFQTGDGIEIRAKYDGYEKAPGALSDGYLSIFKGYFYDFYQGTPLKIKCLDSIYLANKGTYTKTFKTVTLKALLTDVIRGTGLALMDFDSTYTDANGQRVNNTLFDLSLYDITFKDMSPAAVMEYLKKNLGINISLMGTKVYYNIASNTLETVYLSTGPDKYTASGNVLKSELQTTNLTNIKQKVTGLSGTSNKVSSVFQKFKVKAWFLQADGTRDSIEVGDDDGQIREVFYYKIPRLATDELTTARYTELANQALLKARQTKFTGDVEISLYPNCDIFWSVQYNDLSYPDRNGLYVITSRNIKLDTSGFHQTLKLAYLADIL